MEIISLDSGVGKCAIRAASVLRHGGVILYPTDTVYGLGADALSDEAVAKVYAIKGRDFAKPIHAAVADLTMADQYGEVNDIARKLAEKFLPGPLTLILRKRAGVDTGIARGREDFAIRIPDSELCLEIARTFGRPFTTTSANITGAETPDTLDSIIQHLGDAANVIGLAIDGGRLEGKKPSTVVNVVSGRPSVIREGMISAEDILAFNRPTIV